MTSAPSLLVTFGFAGEPLNNLFVSSLLSAPPEQGYWSARQASMQGWVFFFFPPATLELPSSSIFKHLLVIMLNKAALLSPCLGPLDISAPLCKN